MSSGRVIGTVAFTRDPSDVEENLMTKAEGCQLAHLHLAPANHETKRRTREKGCHLRISISG